VRSDMIGKEGWQRGSSSRIRACGVLLTSNASARPCH
jgi:hypothetical protein